MALMHLKPLKVWGILKRLDADIHAVPIKTINYTYLYHNAASELFPKWVVGITDQLVEHGYSGVQQDWACHVRHWQGSCKVVATTVIDYYSSVYLSTSGNDANM